MYNLLQVLTLASSVDAKARDTFVETVGAAAAALPGIRNILLSPTQPGVYNGGDFLLRLVFDDKTACDAALASNAWALAKTLLEDADIVFYLQRVAYEGGRSGGSSDGSGLYRVALFCANVDPTPERLAAFGEQTAGMPNHVRSILRWQLSQTDEAVGDRPWTHVWEQEYADVAGLNGPYMMHPVHWAHVERWFDTEYTEHLVDPILVHTFCAIDRPVIV
jgi:hypothetical protein